jgi:hypothetical protein
MRRIRRIQRDEQHLEYWYVIARADSVLSTGYEVIDRDSTARRR